MSSYGRQLSAWLRSSVVATVVPTIVIGGLLNLVSGPKHPGLLIATVIVLTAAVILLPPVAMCLNESVQSALNYARVQRRVWASAAFSESMIGLAAAVPGRVAYGVLIAALGLIGSYAAFKTGLSLQPPKGGGPRQRPTPRTPQEPSADRRDVGSAETDGVPGDGGAG